MSLYHESTYLECFNYTPISTIKEYPFTEKKDKCLNPHMCQKYEEMDLSIFEEIYSKYPLYSIRVVASNAIRRFCALNSLLVTHRMNYFINVESWDIANLSSSNTRRKLRKSLRSCNVSPLFEIQDMDCEAWNMIEDSAKKYAVSHIISRENLESVHSAGFKLLFRRDFNGNTLSGIIVLVKYGNRLYYPWGAGAVTSLITSTLLDCKHLGIEVFDFEGSNIAGVENFYLQFEPELEFYEEIYFASNPRKTEGLLAKIARKILPEFR